MGKLTDKELEQEKSCALFLSILHGMYSFFLPLMLYMAAMDIKEMPAAEAAPWLIGGYVFMVWIYYRVHMWVEVPSR